MSILDQVTDNILEADSIGLLPETATGDDLSSVVSYRPDDASPLKRVILDTPKVPPQQAVQDAQIAKAKGVTPELVAQQRERFIVENELDEIVNATVDAPATRRYLTNSNNLQVSRNDARRLAALERAAAKMNGVYGDDGDNLAMLEDSFAGGLLSDDISEADVPSVGNLAKGLAKGTLKGATKGAVSILGVMPYNAIAYATGALDDAAMGFEQITGLPRGGAFGAVRDWALANARSIQEGVVESELLELSDDAKGQLIDNPELLLNPEWVADNVAQGVANVLAMAGAAYATGGGSLAAAGMGAMAEAGQLYNDLLADGVDGPTAHVAATGFGGVVGALEKVGADRWLGKERVKSLASRIVKSTVTGAVEAGTEWAEEPTGAFIESIAKGESLEQAAEKAAIASRNIDVMVGAFAAGGSMAYVGKYRSEQKRIEANSAREQELLSALDETAQATETGQLSPEHLQAAVQAIRDQVGENVSTVYVDAEAFIGNLGEEAGAVAERVGISDQLDAAYSSGGLLEIPIAKYAAHIATVPELNNALIEHRKFSPGSMTLSEQQAYFASQQDEMQRLIDVVAEEQAAADVIEQEASDVVKDLTEKLKATGRIKGKERDNAVLYAARLATLARRSGGQYGVKDLYETYGPIIGDSLADVTVKSEGRMMEQAAISAETAGADVNNAAEVEEAARLWQEKGTESPFFKRWFGDSKVVDEQGKPLVVYHGTAANVEAFDPSRAGEFGENFGPAVFFTQDQGVAAGYAARWSRSDEFMAARKAEDEALNRVRQAVLDHGPQSQEADEAQAEAERLGAERQAIADRIDNMEIPTEGANIVPAYLSMQDPLIVDAQGQNFRKVTSEAIQRARGEGKDGVIIRNVVDSASAATSRPSDVYVALEPTQIKSATGNRGTFDPSDARIMYQSAFHGTPHKFDKFTLDAIGSGEGAQAYGWGLYFAGRKDVAEWYREELTRKAMPPREARILVDGKPIGAMPELSSLSSLMKAKVLAALDVSSGSVDGAIFGLNEQIRGAEDLSGPLPSLRSKYAPAFAFLESIRDRNVAIDNTKPKGQLYEVDIPEDDVMLHWDRPLSAQPEKVREALARIEEEMGWSGSALKSPVGRDLYHHMEAMVSVEDLAGNRPGGASQAVSEVLNDYGIRGIKYLDGTSRAAGEGSYNYVIFDDNAIEILNTFYQAKEARPNLQNMQDYARGATFFANSVVRGKTGQPLVALFKHSDESTFMHEAGHVFIEMTRHLATQPGAHPEIVREWQDIKAALGIPNDGKIKSKHHEAFAEALEKYLAQGKAPSMKLRHVFERFFAWMRSVYRSWVSEGVTPDERLVPIFDRMFATDAEIAEVEEYYAAQKPFFTAAEMQDKDEQDRYLKRIKAAQESSREKQFRRYWNAYKKALGGKKRFEEEAKTEVDAMPVYAAADEAVSKGGFSGEDLDYMVGNDLRAELAKKRPGLVTKKGGAAPESVALKYGYDSVQDMVADILNAESKTEAVANRVKHALIAEEQRLRKGLQERGELNGDEAFHGAEQLAVLAAEFEMAQARARGRKAVEKAAKDFTPPEAVQADARAKAQEAADRFHAAWKTKDAKELRAFVRATLDAMQSYQTLAALKEAPLDRDHLVKYYGKDTVADLDAKHPGIVKKDSGRAADDAATELGYADTDALISMLQDTEPRKAAYDSMLAEYEAEFRSDTFDEEAKVFADTYQRFVDSDPRTALARAEYNDKVMLAAGKPSRVEVAAVRAVARKMLAGRKVKDAMNPAKFQTQERKAANAALAAKAKGDMDAALEWKRRQLLNHALVIESMKIREERAATVARLKRALKRDIADTYNAQVVSLLSKFRITGREAKEGTPTLEAFLESIQNSATDSPFMGAVPDLPRWLFDDSKVPVGGATLADTLTVDELRELDAAVKWLVETGYDIKQGRLAAYNEHIKDLVAKLTEPMRELKDKRVVSKRFETWRRLSDATREYFADHNMLAFVLDALDGYTNIGKKGSFGPNRRTIGNALADRQSERDKRMGEASEKLKPIMAQFAESMRKHPKILRTTVPVPKVMREDGDFWNFPKVLAVALNMGNATNMQRVMEGYELTPEQLTELTSVLSPEDWNAVQQVWDTLNEYWVDMNDVHKRTYHFEMNKVKADPITVQASDGSQVRLRGGYYPIKFNPRYARQVGAWSEKDDLMQDSVFGHPATKSGMTKDRKGAGVRLPVLLDISVLYGHIEDSIHFITHADLIRDLDRITQNTEFQNTVRQKMGREVAEMFRPMLRHIARPERQMNVVIERGFDRMRAMSTAYILGLNTSVALKQVFSLPGIWHDIGMSNYAKGLIHVMRNPVQAYHAMREASTYMATRSDSFDRDLKDSLGRMSGGRMSRGYLDVARDWAFALIRLMDFVAVYPSWHGAYKLGLEKEGGHEGAVRFADEMIRQSQPSSKPMDMSKIQYKRGGLFKAMSMFMTFTAKYGNRQRHFARAYFKDKKITAREYAWHLMLEAVAPPVLMNLMFAAIWGDEPDEKDMLIDVISYQFSGYVLLRDIAGVVSAAVKHSALDKDVFKPNLDRVPALTGLTLAERAVTNTVKWVADMDDEDARNKAFLDVAEMLSFFAGVPAPKLARKLAKGYEQFEDDGNPLLLVVPDYSQD